MLLAGEPYPLSRARLLTARAPWRYRPGSSTPRQVTQPSRFPNSLMPPRPGRSPARPAAAPCRGRTRRSAPGPRPAGRHGSRAVRPPGGPRGNSLGGTSCGSSRNVPSGSAVTPDFRRGTVPSGTAIMVRPSGASGARSWRMPAPLVRRRAPRTRCGRPAAHHRRPRSLARGSGGAQGRRPDNPRDVGHLGPAGRRARPASTARSPQTTTASSMKTESGSPQRPAPAGSPSHSRQRGIERRVHAPEGKRETFPRRRFVKRFTSHFCRNAGSRCILTIRPPGGTHKGH
jgi:hypothetical protein